MFFKHVIMQSYLCALVWFISFLKEKKKKLNYSLKVLSLGSLVSSEASLSWYLSVMGIFFF